jgi:hypothetical protein
MCRRRHKRVLAAFDYQPAHYEVPDRREESR